MFKLNLKRRDIVLEVGSGDFPNIYSDILLDKYPDTNKYRNFDLKTEGRPLIVADAEALPFRDQSFDYCISANAVTYSENPEKFFAELSRVAPRGLLILPTELQERLYDIPYHRWFINYVDGKLIFRPKRIERSFGRFFHLLYKENFFFRKFQEKNISLFYIAIQWKGKIIFEVQRDKTDSVINLNDEKEIMGQFPLRMKSKGLLLSRKAKDLFPNKFKYFLLKNIIKLSRYPRPRINIEDLIVCPVCRQSLEKEIKSFVCTNCGLDFPIRDNVPYLLTDIKV